MFFTPKKQSWEDLPPIICLPCCQKKLHSVRGKIPPSPLEECISYRDSKYFSLDWRWLLIFYTGGWQQECPHMKGKNSWTAESTPASSLGESLKTLHVHMIKVKLLWWSLVQEGRSNNLQDEVCAIVKTGQNLVVCYCWHSSKEEMSILVLCRRWASG